MTGELSVSGYPPEDLVRRPSFLKAVREAVESLAAETVNGPAVLLGAPWVEDDVCYNAAILLE